MYPRAESNRNRRNRNPKFYPLNYGGKNAPGNPAGRKPDGKYSIISFYISIFFVLLPP